ncbi:SPFH domain-containing protein [Cellulomonas fimi]|uniref:Band 7 protein n=1 Tax=Cellulomonas fimi (strain ATCC 484 / DSM 20113 / JCM 1341 / CCUG 24087 / LMG 16345 / NBRC 15513 / NCIMB 8980 / NCTC 7547 / NRS-133) TaxID=590998 RepID=F4H8H4_CELFA|nr:SPFH domain-containing protein [Cellulomonas fimi]AEE45855.1 band 7 protein [Cellulomonas fimi ATCC 484]NNH07839.1 SPFH/Band 7/PHB domain protein [Cellulomonas fimi]VEH30798.1 FtsH protease regulator HflK [Cellulomonas fimi]
MDDTTNVGQIALYIVLGLALLFVVVALIRSVRIVPQTVAMIVERLGRYSRTLDAGLHLLIPFVDRIRAGVDLREQVVSFPPQPVITSDNLVVSIDTVIYFQVTDPKSAVYEIANYIMGIEQLTVTTLRNVIGSMDLEQTLTSRDQINGQLRGVLDEATGRWGIRVNRVELKAIDPPASVQGSMEQQMRAERDRRAAILTAEGVKQSQILTAEGEKQAAILRAEGDAQSAILRAEGEARAILQVFDAVHRGDADPKLLAYQYLQTLPKIAASPSNKMWFLPSELSGALGQLARGFGGEPADGATADSGRPAGTSPLGEDLPPTALTDPAQALAEARRESAAATADATSAGTLSGRPFDPGVELGQRPGGGAVPMHKPTDQPPAAPDEPTSGA